MLPTLLDQASPDTVPLIPLTAKALESWLVGQDAPTRAWVTRLGFKADAGATALLPGFDGALGRILVGLGQGDDPWAFGGLPTSLPAGSYRIEGRLDAPEATRAALAWALGSYAFQRYRKTEKRPASLVWPEGADRAAVERAASAAFLVRDLVNTPANDMGPAELADAAQALAREFGAAIEVIVGDALLDRNYPMIHAVGRASARAPRLIDLTWGPEDAPRVTLVGKGVCFDSGGLDIKPSSGMLLMKKDMGGAAQALGLARMVMMAGLPVRLRVLVPAVENAVSGNAFRPLDVIPTRKGTTVEIGNTDAEGRLILCDALAAAAEEKPDLLIDFATLTGAARVALGPDLPALFSNDDALAAELLDACTAAADPMWRLPLHKPYRKMLDSKIADINNVGNGPFGGAITAALFLESFVPPEVRWAHIDLYAWNNSTRPGRPEGGEAMTIRAVYAYLEKNYSKSR